MLERSSNSPSTVSICPERANGPRTTCRHLPTEGDARQCRTLTPLTMNWHAAALGARRPAFRGYDRRRPRRRNARPGRARRAAGRLEGLAVRAHAAGDQPAASSWPRRATRQARNEQTPRTARPPPGGALRLDNVGLPGAGGAGSGRPRRPRDACVGNPSPSGASTRRRARRRVLRRPPPATTVARPPSATQDVRAGRRRSRTRHVDSNGDDDPRIPAGDPIDLRQDERQQRSRPATPGLVARRPSSRSAPAAVWLDTNGDGVIDGDDDSDGDGVSNAHEERNGTDPAGRRQRRRRHPRRHGRPQRRRLPGRPAGPDDARPDRRSRRPTSRP